MLKESKNTNNSNTLALLTIKTINKMSKQTDTAKEAIEAKASSKGIVKLNRKKSEYTTLQSFKNAVNAVIELDLVCDESKQLLLAIQDESVQLFISKKLT